MYYGDLLENLLVAEKNPVNRMYLNEIKLKWLNFEKEVENKENSNDIILKALNNFLNTLNNKKFKYIASSNKGFKPESEIFTPFYIDDLISVFMQKKKILNHLGISWGKQSFSTGLQFNPISFRDLQDSPNYEYGESPEFLMLVQQIDFQFKIVGKHRFNKHLINFPLIVFLIYRNLTQDDLIKTDYYANMALRTFSKAKIVIVTETLDKSVTPDVRSLPIDSIFVLRKQFKDVELSPISIDVINALEQKIDSFLAERYDITENFIETGVIH
ncbi:MAG: hypothetical protein Q7J16_08395 [Candidatus Cloacimonadales bacterium]|nr:hypothetical protein [Candidatus Cloacimonadales bacterium]